MADDLFAFAESEDESPWQEVPQARFLSWSDAMQRAYCAARDRDSAANSDSLEWCEFFLERAKGYAT
jgi:hypothetical protein